MKNLKATIPALLLAMTGLTLVLPPFQVGVLAQTATESPRIDTTSQQEAIAHLDKAYELAQFLADPSDQSWALRSIAVVYAEAEQSQKADEVFRQAIAAANRIAEPDLQSLALRNIASVYAEAGQSQKADKVFRQAITAANRISDPHDKSWALSDIAVAYAKAGQFDQALAAASQIDPDERTGILTSIVIAYAEAGKDPQVALDQIQDPAKKLWTTIYFHLAMAEKILEN